MQTCHPWWRPYNCGPSGETRTPDILLPKRFSVFFIVVYSSLWNYPIQSNYFLALLFPLFPSAPALSVVKHVVKEPFLTRCVIRCRRLSRRALFSCSGFAVLYLWQSLKASHFCPSGVSVFSTPNQRNILAPRR